MPPQPNRWIPPNTEVVKSILRQRITRDTWLDRGERPCVRWFAGRADGRDGLVIDGFGAVIVVTDYARTDVAVPSVEAANRDLVSFLRGALGQVHVILKIRTGGEGQESFRYQSFPPEPSLALPILATERGLRFEIGTDPAHDFGLFLDAAKARQWVRGRAKGKRVLNLFSYTAGFGVAAAVGGASAVTNVDPNREYLAWGKRNAALNGVEIRVLPDTAQVFLRRQLRRLARVEPDSATESPAAQPFDMVIVDPPAFGVGRGQDRILRRLWPEIFAALQAMRPRELVILCNDKYFRSRTRFEDLVQEGLGGEYRFARIGTCLDGKEVATDGPLDFEFRPGVEDPYFMEPIVLVGERA